ncbi:TetR family transcriptional regulator [Chitinimonas prasina]|uniref:TetR family transcriptional regulator n=1 Tax=Chitinimonas prasina TaxID=1434937 RepID=A0ABQ5YC91_9NEIS|nr:TetR/AcrR family transcriptional regulator [Chitinimonas prasina]GLR11658.1 TetR family transcriptional regulator [Chitinimonas prasina]
MKTPSEQRRQPCQARAQMKVALIFEATLRILEQEGEAALNTNRIAAVAGISIGTLYQYFPDKDAVLVALVQEEISRCCDAIRAGFAQLPASARYGDGQRADVLVRVLLGAFGGKVGARRELVRALQARQLSLAFDQYIIEQLHGILPSLPLPKAVLAILIRSLLHTVDATLLHDETMLQRPGLKLALIKTVQSLTREGMGLGMPTARVRGRQPSLTA